LHVCACPDPKQVLDELQMREQKPYQCSERKKMAAQTQYSGAKRRSGIRISFCRTGFL